MFVPLAFCCYCPAGKKKRKGQEAKLFGFNSFSSCPDLTHLNIYSPAVKPRGLSLAFYCVVMTQSSSPRNYVPFGYFSISRFTPNQHSVSMQEVVCLYVAKLKVRLRRIGVVYGRVVWSSCLVIGLQLPFAQYFPNRCVDLTKIFFSSEPWCSCRIQIILKHKKKIQLNVSVDWSLPNQRVQGAPCPSMQMSFKNIRIICSSWLDTRK